MKASAGALLAANVWPGKLAAEDAKTSPLRFVVLNDLHYIDKGCDDWFEALMKAVTAEKPDLVFAAGDLTEHGTEAALGAIKEHLAALKCPVHAIPGNHDWATKTDRAPWQKLFKNSDNFIIKQDTWQFLLLDSTDGLKYENVAASKETLAFVADATRQLDKQHPLIVVTHFPVGKGVKYRLTNADELLAPLKEFNLRYVFGGHYHALTEKKIGDTPVVTNRCCALRRNNHDGSKEKGFFTCVAMGDGTVKREFVEFKGPAATRPADAKS